MKDERIEATTNHFAAIGFLIWFFLMSVSLCYRTMILKQHIREFWDISIIFCFGIFFVFIAYAKKGVFDHGFKTAWLTIGIVIPVVSLAVFFIMGQVRSVGDVLGGLIGVLFGIGLVIGIAYFLNRRWKRKEGLEEEK